MTAKLTKEQIDLFKEELMKCLDEMRDALELEQQNLENQEIIEFEDDNVDSELMACIDLMYDLNYLTEPEPSKSENRVTKPDSDQHGLSNLIRFER